VTEKSYDYLTGPVTLRRSQVPPTTTDQRLLDNAGPADWLHADPWRVLRIQSEFVEGFGALAEVGPAVNFGPGDPNWAHHDQEHCPVGQLVDCEAALLRWLDAASA
jgi:hypothetical protein